MGSVLGRSGTPVPVHKLLGRYSSGGIEYEVRRYAPRVMAEAPPSQGENSGFNTLANYIGVFGNPQNLGAVAMGMTAPVATRPVAMGMTAPVATRPVDMGMTSPVATRPVDMGMTSPVATRPTAQRGGSVMGFVLPAQYTRLEDAPVPRPGLGVTLRLEEERDVAVYKFSGLVQPGEEQGKLQRLMDALLPEHKARVARVAGGGPRWELCRYDPPYTIPALRTNEIWVYLNDT